MVASPPGADMEELISTSVAAVLLGVNPLTVRRWVDQGTLTGTRVGPLLVLRRDEVEALALQRQQPRPHRLAPCALRVLTVLADVGDAVPASRLGELTGIDPGSTRHHLSILRVRGLVVRVGRARASTSGPPPWLWRATSAGCRIVAA